jgi:hypothetical protein
MGESMSENKTQGALPETAADALKRAAQVKPSAADPMARIKAVERATELARRLYPDHFKKENT